MDKEMKRSRLLFFNFLKIIYLFVYLLAVLHVGS